MASPPNISNLSTTGTPPSAGNTTGAGSTSGAPTGSVNDLFAQLHGFQWKGVDFPTTEFDTEVREDLVIHKMADRNGAYVESVGRHPVQVTATIPFNNYIVPAANENWPPGNLYPYQWRFFLRACLDGTSGNLVHPELGPLNCKLDMARTTWRGNERGGVVVHATWIESDDTQADQVGQDLSSASPIAAMTSNADDLDANIATLQSAVSLQENPLPSLPFSFSALASSITGAIDSVTVLEKEYQGRVDNLIYQANEVEDALSTASAASPLNWPIFQGAERLKAAAYALKAQPQVAQGKALATYTLTKDSTMGQLIAQLGVDPPGFIALNYGLVGAPVVPKGTMVQYFQPAA